MNAFTEFLHTTTDGRERKRALAVTMTLAGAAWGDVRDDLRVRHALLRKGRSHDQPEGIARLRMGYQGSVGDLTAEQKAQSRAWLRRHTPWSVTTLPHEMRRSSGGD